MLPHDLFQTGLSFFNSARGRLRGAVSDSLVEYTQVGRVEPLVLIDGRAMQLDCIGDVQQSLLAIFSGYYLQAAALINNIGNVRALDRLESLNPNRSPVTSVMDGNIWFFNKESYDGGLPFADDPKIVKRCLSMEASTGYIQDKLDFGKDPGQRVYGVGSHLGKSDYNKAVNELANLSVGKTYEIDITDGKNTLKLPVNIRLSAQMVTPSNLIHILTTGEEDTGAKERYHGWKSGRLSFWKDLVFANDLIDKHRRDLMKDPSGVLSNVERAKLNNDISTVVSGNPSVATASGIVVMVQDTADELEMQLEGKLTKFEVRQRMMKKTSLMLMAIIDTDNQYLTVYHRGIDRPTHVRLKDLRAATKGSGPDVSEILKAYLAGAAPSL